MTSRLALRFCLVVAMSGIPFLSMAQDESPAGEVGDPASIRTQRLTPDQLADLVAPIALYPDPLLSQLLVASTYPLEVVEAKQWLDRNERLTGQQLTEAARRENWDASLQGLVAFPDVLAMLNRDVQWTAALGNAFLAQESDVMAAVQRLRARAKADGKLSSTPQQTVTTENVNGVAAIDIAPADPQLIYVPQYDPAYVWGPPAWGDYPALPYSWGYGFGPAIDIGLCFGGWPGWGWGWGWGPNWFAGSVYVNGPFFRHYGYHSGHMAGGYGGRGDWHHDPGHRHGVAYPDRGVAARYNAASHASRTPTARAGSWDRSGAATGSRYGSRSVEPSARYAGSRSVSRAGEEPWRNPRTASRGQAQVQRSAAAASRNQAAPRYQPAPRYQSAQRNQAASRTQPAPRYQSAQRSYAPTGGGRSFGGGGGSYGSGGGRSTGGFSSGGGSHGGGSHGGGRH